LTKTTAKQNEKMTEYLRPWKLATLAVGIAILLIVGHIEQLDDWTPGVSVIMALAAYLTAPWAVRVFIERRWGMMPFAFLTGWFSVEVLYAFFQFHRVPPAVFAALVNANRLPSTCLYLLCGFIWLYRGSFKDLVSEARAALASLPLRHR
jgi:hypothetical protein